MNESPHTTTYYTITGGVRRDNIKFQGVIYLLHTTESRLTARHVASSSGGERLLHRRGKPAPPRVQHDEG